MVAGGGGGAGVAAFGNSGGNGGGSSGSRGQSSSNGGYGGTRTKGGTSIADGSPSSCLGSRSGNYMRGGHGSGCRKVGDGGYGGGGNAGGLTGGPPNLRAPRKVLGCARTHPTWMFATRMSHDVPKLVRAPALTPRPSNAVAS